MVARPRRNLFFDLKCANCAVDLTLQGEKLLMRKDALAGDSGAFCEPTGDILYTGLFPVLETVGATSLRALGVTDTFSLTTCIG